MLLENYLILSATSVDDSLLILPSNLPKSAAFLKMLLWLVTYNTSLLNWDL